MYNLDAMIQCIKDTKKQKNLSNDDLVALSGVPRGTLNKILGSETKDPQISNIIKISKALNVSADYLIFGQDNTKQSSPSKDEEENVDEIAKALYEWLIHTGFLKEGQDLTEQQVKGLHGLSDILMALFGEEFK